MRLVPNLTELNECLNCGHSLYLREIKDYEGKPFVICVNCHEEFYEEEQSAPSKEEILFGLREMADVLPHWAESNRDTLLMEMIRDIFHKLIDYLEEN